MLSGPRARQLQQGLAACTAMGLEDRHLKDGGPHLWLPAEEKTRGACCRRRAPGPKLSRAPAPPSRAAALHRPARQRRGDEEAAAERGRRAPWALRQWGDDQSVGTVPLERVAALSRRTARPWSSSCCPGRRRRTWRALSPRWRGARGGETLCAAGKVEDRGVSAQLRTAPSTSPGRADSRVVTKARYGPDWPRLLVLLTICTGSKDTQPRNKQTACDIHKLWQRTVC
ncbi:unnamed protein product [Prorocentrum cordatum]|uniref:Uncharacterized protein n=1 Tax=Prorocentrum cordatum TaxID=2364126 RepID=A0ABN9WN89_9DINO|nr:unnamed protein product [Polarella glacialis]